MVLVVFVGDSPSKLMLPGAPAFVGARCESRLRSWISLEAPTLEILVVNQTDSGFEEIKNANAVFVAMGENASKALKGIRHFKLPHPSGLNRKLNDKVWLQSQLEQCRLFIVGGAK